MKLNPPEMLMAAAAVALVGAGLFIWKKGGVGAAAAAVGAGAVNTAGAVVSGGVGAIGSAVGLPTPSQTTTDAKVARWIVDTYGYFEASKWAGAGALWQAMLMDEGSGTPPPAGSDLAKALPAKANAATAGSTLYTPVNTAALTFEQASSADPLDYMGWKP